MLEWFLFQLFAIILTTPIGVQDTIPSPRPKVVSVEVCWGTPAAR